ncbi:MAG: tRNA (cytidine(34)-2'-O)-methyltransferase [Anaerolineae bacterium]
MDVVLFQPEIPQNTGNIVRTCSVTGCGLILVRPLGFSISNRHLKRAGLDYWKEVQISFIDDLTEFLENTCNSFYFFSSRAERCYSDVDYQMSDLLIFGSETKGLPMIFRQRWPDKFCKIPMKEESRCLNLANAASIAIYEAWRKQGFR